MKIACAAVTAVILLGLSSLGDAQSSAVFQVPPGTNFRSASSVAVDRVRNVIVADRARHQILGFTPTGELLFVAGTGIAGYRGDGHAAPQAQLNSPSGLALDQNGNLYFADTGNHRIRRITPEGIITTVAGNGRAGSGGDGGAATSARLNRPADVAVDQAGNIYVADSFNHRIRRVSPDGKIHTIAGRKKDPREHFDGDGGEATRAVLDFPWSLALDRSATVYFRQNFGLIRNVTADGRIDRVAGFYLSDNITFGGDGGPALKARLDSAGGLATDIQGNLYFADLRNRRVRRIRADGIMETVLAGLQWPMDVAIDSVGDLYVADGTDVLKVTPASGAPASTDFGVTGITTAATASPQAARTIRIKPGLLSGTVMGIDKFRRELTVARDGRDYLIVRVPENVPGFETLRIGSRINGRYGENVLRAIEAGRVKRAPVVPSSISDVAAALAPSTLRTMTGSITAIDTRIPGIAFKGPNGWDYEFGIGQLNMLQHVKVGEEATVTWESAVLVSFRHANYGPPLGNRAGQTQLPVQ